MDQATSAKRKFIRVQLLLGASLAVLVFGLRYFLLGQLEAALWFSLILFTEIILGGVFLWSIFQFYQPKKTFSFNPIFILISISLIIGEGFYFLSKFLVWIDRDDLYYVPLPFHLTGLMFLFWVMFYEWWFLKNELKSEYNTQRLLMLQDDLKSAEIKNIQQNVQPHFLFNSLNSINSLMLINVEEAQKMIVQLSEFLRHSVLKNQKMYVKIEDELAQMERYFSIEKIRFASRLNYSIQCPDELKELEIPSMLLQPLLENAIKYGLYGQIEKSEINISLTQFGHQIWVRIQNSYDPENQPVKGTGFGIKSVRQKLYWLFAETNLLETKQDGKTFTVQIKIPLRQHESTLGR